MLSPEASFVVVVSACFEVLQPDDGKLVFESLEKNLATSSGRIAEWKI